MKTALIIGISGQDGSLLAKFLLDKGYKVYGTSRDAELQTFTNLKKLNVLKKCHLSSLSVTDTTSIINCLEETKPDEIYNLSGQSSVGLSFKHPHETYLSISDATLNILEAIRILQITTRYYNACSSECFGNITGSMTADENTVFHPRSPYAVAKAAAFWTTSLYREAYGIFTSSGILFNHESSLRPNRFVSQKIINSVIEISKGKKEYLELGNIDISRDWGWAPEYVEAMYLMLKQNKPDDFVICTGKSNTLREFIKEAFNFFDLEYEKYIHYKKTFIRPSEITRSAGNNQKAKEKLSWEASFEMKDVVKKLISEKIK